MSAQICSPVFGIYPQSFHVPSVHCTSIPWGTHSTGIVVQVSSIEHLTTCQVKHLLNILIICVLIITCNSLWLIYYHYGGEVELIG